jgi:hypothetical protein
MDTAAHAWTLCPPEGATQRRKPTTVIMKGGMITVLNGIDHICVATDSRVVVIMVPAAQASHEGPWAHCSTRAAWPVQRQ